MAAVARDRVNNKKTVSPVNDESIERQSRARDVEILTADGRTLQIGLRDVRRIGNGRAARALLVEADLPEGKELIVEKHFDPPALTRAVYSLFFLSPFPYGHNRDAILACLYRRRVADAFLRAAGEHDSPIAPALYVRRCEGNHWVLGTQFVKGRPVAPPAPRMGPELGGQPAEMRDLLATMKRMERILVDSGLVGTGWQMATETMVATANFIRNEDGRFVSVDIESGIPAVVSPRYMVRALLRGMFPFFDDCDPKRLRHTLNEREALLRDVLGHEGFADLERDVEALIAHSIAWKESEPAPGRHGFRLLFDRSLRDKLRKALADRWEEDGRLDRSHADRLRHGRMLWSRPMVLAGFLPSVLGRSVQKLFGNSAFRARVLRTLLSPTMMRTRLCEYEQRKVSEWLAEERIVEADAPRLTRGFRSLSMLLAHRVASIFSRRTHRFLTDWSYAGSAMELAVLALVSKRIQSHLAREYLMSAAETWMGLGRLERQGIDQLDEDLTSGDVEDTIRGFGMHLALKLFQPFTFGLKTIGVAMLLTSAWPLGLMLMVNTSIIRTMLTALLWFSGRKRGISYAVAFTIGVLPAVGTFAFPMQLYSRRPWLANFMIRTSLSRAADAIPIWGGRATRIEVFVVRSAWIVTAVLSRLLMPFKYFGRSDAVIGPPEPTAGGWFARRVQRSLDWYQTC